MQQPWGAVREASLLLSSLAALQERLQDLLADWPDNALLVQLLAICHRIQGDLAPGHLVDGLQPWSTGLHALGWLLLCVFELCPQQHGLPFPRVQSPF